jgi:hypothetical protein
MKKNKNIYIIIFSIFVLYSCQTKKSDSNNINNYNEIELFSNDYNIIEYNETKMIFYENRIQINLTLEIINAEKTEILKNAINPIIFLNFNNRKYLAKGNFVLSSSIPPECDYFFSIDKNKKITFFDDKIIGFIGFEEREIK